MSNEECWTTAARPSKLAADEVHVWRVYVDRAKTELHRFESTFTSEERVRANRLRHACDRDVFVATRGVLRELLGSYLGCPPAEVKFGYGDRGKPFLRDALLDLQFNVSHSRSLALLAFTRGRSLGIDVEFVRPGLWCEEVAERYFSPRELYELWALPPTMRADGFFLAWTRKEAYLKARGDGLQLGFGGFHVSLTPGQPERLDSGDGSEWSMHSLRPDPHYAAALVGEGQDWRPRYWDWHASRPASCG